MEYAIDTHFHVWDFKNFSYNWPTSDLEAIYRPFSLTDFEQEKAPTPVKYGVFVQCLDRTPDEAEWVLKQCKLHPFVKGVVAGLDLQSPQLAATLDKLSQYPEFVGARHILDNESPDWIAKDDVSAGLWLLEERGYTYDLLLRPHLLKYIPEVVRRHPRLKFVVDHIAKPLIKDGVVEGWKKEMEAIAQFPNVYCKISGLVTEADWDSWKRDDFKEYVEHILSIFGEDRVMFGSDWPVLKLAHADYSGVYNLAVELTQHLPEEAKRKLFAENAKIFYNMKIP